jgi:hypothetical protein
MHKKKLSDKLPPHLLNARKKSFLMHIYLQTKHDTETRLLAAQPFNPPPARARPEALPNSRKTAKQQLCTY